MRKIGIAILLAVTLAAPVHAGQCGCAPPVEPPLPEPTPLPEPVVPLWPRVWLPWVGK